MIASVRLSWLACSAVVCVAATLGVYGFGWGEVTGMFVGAVILGAD